MHLKKRLAQKTIDALKKTSSAAVPGKRKIERVNLGLRSVGISRRVSLE
jgi:hypothetical protein